MVSVFTGGGFFGAMIAGPMGDMLGRKRTILIGAVVFLLGGALQTGAQNLGYLYSGRAIAGLGVGVLVMIVPLYQAELAHPSIRGRITALQQFMLGIGALIASWVSYGKKLEIFHVAFDRLTMFQVPMWDFRRTIVLNGESAWAFRTFLPSSSQLSSCFSPSHLAG